MVINEVAWSGTVAKSKDEWIELHNTNTQCSVSLKDWQLSGIRGSTRLFTVTFDSGDVIPKNGYFLIGAADDIFASITIDKVVDFDTTSGNQGLSDGGESLLLSGPGATGLIDSANLLGLIPWPAGTSSNALVVSTRNRSMERYRATNDTDLNWVTFIGPVPGFDPRDKDNHQVRGTPGRKNWAADRIVTPSPAPTRFRTATPRPPTPFAHMVINEFLPRAASDWNHDGAVDVYDEFIELKNLGPIDVDLAGWKLDDVAAAGSPIYTLPSLKLKPGERALYYGLTTRILLDDSGDSVRLINSRNIVIDSRGYGVIEHPDESHCRIPDGYYWREACFATPGNENALTGQAPEPAPVVVGAPAPCLLPDTVPEPFRQAECDGFGEDTWDRTFWDEKPGPPPLILPGPHSKWNTIIE